MKTLSDLCHALRQVAQRIRGDGRDLDVRRRVAGPQVQNMVQIAHTLLDLGLGETTFGSQLSQRHGSVRNHDGHAGMVDAVVPVGGSGSLFGQLGGALGLEQLVHFGVALALVGQFVLLLGAIPISRPCLQLAQLAVCALKARAQFQALFEVIGGLGGTTEGEIGRGALEVGQVIVWVAGNGSIVVDEGIGGVALGQVLLGIVEESEDGRIGGDVLKGEGGDGRQRRRQAEEAGSKCQGRQSDIHGRSIVKVGVSVQRECVWWMRSGPLV